MWNKSTAFNEKGKWKYTKTMTVRRQQLSFWSSKKRNHYLLFLPAITSTIWYNLKWFSIASYTWVLYFFGISKNTYFSEDITEEKLTDLISYSSKGSVNYWSAVHNCATVACDAWNLISDVKVSPYSSDFLFGTVATPNGLKE